MSTSFLRTIGVLFLCLGLWPAHALAIGRDADESMYQPAQAHAGSWGGGWGGGLVAAARQYVGRGNPTRRSSLWCGAFMDLVLRQTGHKPGSTLARDYEHYGTRVSGPVVGAIAVFARGKGGHVGVVSGIAPDGNVIIISGNYNGNVAEAEYPRRAIAYVLPQ